MSDVPPFTPLLQSLPATVPFVPPEALERNAGRPLVLRLGANESAFGISPRAHEAMRRDIDRMAWYGDPESYDLRTALASKHGTAIENIVVGSGIDDLLGLLVRAYVS